MINGADLRDFYINAWRNIPDLVDVLANQDPSMIRSSWAVAKISKSLLREATGMPQGSIYVAYQGFTKGNTRYGEQTSHQLAAFIRSLTDGDDENVDYGALMIDGIPVDEELPVRYLSPNVDCNPMDMPRFERVSSADMNYDIWKLSFSVPENAP